MLGPDETPEHHKRHTKGQAMPDADITYQGLHHVVLVCRDMERTVDFYSNVLGMTLKKGFDLPNGYGQHFFFDMGGGNELAFFWFRDAPAAQPGVATPANLVGRDGNISSAHGSMNHVAFKVAADKIDDYRESLEARGVDVSPVFNHNDVVTGEAARAGGQITDSIWVRSCYFFDPDGVMLELCADVQPGSPSIDLPVNADGVKSNGHSLS